MEGVIAELLKLRLSQGLVDYENFLTEQPDRPLNFVPYYTKEVLNKEDFK